MIEDYKDYLNTKINDFLEKQTDVKIIEMLDSMKSDLDSIGYDPNKVDKLAEQLDYLINITKQQ